MPTATLPFVPMRPDNFDLETTVGRAIVTAKIENFGDVWNVEQELIEAGDVRSVETDEALVDTGASVVGLPTQMIRQLGLMPLYTRPVRSALGPGKTTVYGAVRVTIQGRECFSDVFELPDDAPVLIGQIPLEQLDFVIDPKAQKLIGNPAHGGEHVIEAY